MTRCNCCGSDRINTLYRVCDVPVFQNLNFETREEALDIARGDITLVSCGDCGFTWNGSFVQEKMVYDERYENEQGNSSSFQRHLDCVEAMLLSKELKGKKIIEIGCGQGRFLQQLCAGGFDVTGFDPAYIGDSENIVKEYYSASHKSIDADVVILRHVLEHIPQPETFLTQLAGNLKPSCILYIEVPDFMWIVQKSAFWDIHYEHCNYFTEGFFGMTFREVDTGVFFGGQYRYAMAEAGMLGADNDRGKREAKSLVAPLGFEERIAECKRIMNGHKGLMLWGGGAKATSLLNILDKDSTRVRGVIDINKNKQGKYIAGTAHKIVGPEVVGNSSCSDILIMNENYEDEIRGMLPDKINVMVLR